MKRFTFRFGFAALVTISIFVITVPTVMGQSRFEVEYMDLTIYRDGLVNVKQKLLVNDFFPEVSLQILSPMIENLVVLDQDHVPVDYLTKEDNVTIFTLGAESVNVEYDTIALTMKEAEVWTLITDNPYNATILLPQNSTVIYLNNVPAAIDTTGSEIKLSLNPGRWEVSYVVPLSSDDNRKDGGSFLPGIANEYLILTIGTIAAIVVVSVFLMTRRKRPNVKKVFKAHPELKKEDRDIIQFLGEKGGKAFEAEIRTKFPDMPRTSLWRLVRRLERLEIVEIKKIGLENQVELK